jgi:hypothetical protein
MKKLILILSIFLAGCATSKPSEVAQCPKPILPAEPVDYLAIPNPKHDPSVFAKACVATRESYRSYHDQCLNILKGYQ